MAPNIQKAVIRMPGDVHVNQPLTNISVAYMQSTTNFIAGKVFPRVSVSKQSDIYWAYKREDWNRGKLYQRAPATEARVVGFGTERATYYADIWALAHDIADPTRANADSIFNMDRDATQFLTMQALLHRELNWMDKYMKAGVWGTEYEGTVDGAGSGEFLFWNDPASTPIEDIRAAKRDMLLKTGFMPNTLTLGRGVYDALVDHPDIVDRVKYGQTPNGAAIVNMQALAALFEVERVLVSDAIVNGSAPGVAESNAFVAGDHALLTYSPSTPSLMMPSAGYTFAWDGWFGASADGYRIKKFRMEELEADRIEIQAAYDQKVVAADMGVFFEDAVGELA